jgi:hypothetical protein
MSAAGLLEQRKLGGDGQEQRKKDAHASRYPRCAANTSTNALDVYGFLIRCGLFLHRRFPAMRSLDYVI